MTLDDNPFMRPSDLPYGLPPFDRIRPEHIMPAVKAGLAAQRAEWDAIATDPAPPTIANTLEALERSGQLLQRALTVQWTLSSSVIDEGVSQRDRAIAPLLAEHMDALHLDRRLYSRVVALRTPATGPADQGVSDEALRLIERTDSAFVRAGAALDDDARDRLRSLNARLSLLAADFKAVLVAGANATAVHITDSDDLDGLDAASVSTAAAAAAGRGLDGWLLTLSLPTRQPHLATLTNRDVRRRLFEASIGRGLGAHDTRALLTAIVALRAERASLLGFSDHASYIIADQTAGDVGAVHDTLLGMVPAAVANAESEAVALQELLTADGHDGALQPWDWAFYAERVRHRRFGVDDGVLRPYFALDRVVRQGIFLAAERLYGITFLARPDLPAYHPDVTVWEVIDVDGSGLGLCLIDPYSRDSKRGGAWMTTLSDQSDLLAGRPVVTLTLNVAPPAEGTPALLPLDEVETAFHEFGHALHGLFSAVTYPQFSGTSVPRDFVEFPSQVNEMWAFDRSLLSEYAVHHATGEALPKPVVDQLLAGRRDGQGFATVEYLAAALLDLAWHRLPAGTVVAAEDVEEFEANALRDVGLDLPAIPPRYRSAYFSHIFAGGYSAGYYAYIWAEILDAEMVDWFTANGGLRRANGDVFRQGVLAVGGSTDPIRAFEEVLGRPPTPGPLLDRRGLRPPG